MKITSIKLLLIFIFHFIPAILALAIYIPMQEQKYKILSFVWLLISLIPVGLIFYTIYLYFINALIMIAISVFLLIPLLIVNSILFLITNRYSQHFKIYLISLIIVHVVLGITLK